VSLSPTTALGNAPGGGGGGGGDDDGGDKTLTSSRVMWPSGDTDSSASATGLGEGDSAAAEAAETDVGEKRGWSETTTRSASPSACSVTATRATSTEGDKRAESTATPERPTATATWEGSVGVGGSTAAESASENKSSDGGGGDDDAPGAMQEVAAVAAVEMRLAAEKSQNLHWVVGECCGWCVGPTRDGRNANVGEEEVGEEGEADRVAVVVVRPRACGVCAGGSSSADSRPITSSALAVRLRVGGVDGGAGWSGDDTGDCTARLTLLRSARPSACASASVGASDATGGVGWGVVVVVVGGGGNRQLSN
jgi:hypothetical protein